MRSPTGALLLAACALAVPAPAAAEIDLHLLAGLSGGRTEWRGDVAAMGVAKAGLDVDEWLGFYFLGRLGYAGVDQRMLTYVSAGVQLWPVGELGGVRPFGRLSIAHQHEESLSVVANDPFGAIFGIGDGIRHRGGLEGALGVDVPLDSFEGTDVFASFELSTIWFYDPRGPHWYVTGGAGLGLRYDL